MVPVFSWMMFSLQFHSIKNEQIFVEFKLTRTLNYIIKTLMSLKNLFISNIARMV